MSSAHASVPAYAGPVPGSLHAGPVHVGPVPTTVGTRKRKAADAADGDCERRAHAPALPALAGFFSAFGDADNTATLAALHMLPGQSNAAALHMNLAASAAAVASSDMAMSDSSSAMGRDTSSPASSAYDLPLTPTASSLDLYPGLSRGAANGADRDGGTFCGLLGPQHGATSDAMQTDDGAASPAPQHGPHCQGIAQLSVRHDPVTGAAELWATCPSCGAYTRVQS